MPRGDRTGPGGMGPMTGRAAGLCAGYTTPGYANPGPRAGLGFAGGFGGGAGRGWRHMHHATGQPGLMRFGGYAAPYQAPDPEQEKQALKNQSEALQSELDFIKKRLGEIETGTAEE